jgi:ribonuclease P protein component
VKLLGLPAASRLRGSRAFTGKFARRVSAGALVLLVRPSSNALSSLGLVVPKAVIAKASQRNEVKRQIREWFRVYRVGCGSSEFVIRIRSPIALRSVRTELNKLAQEL